jgi:hypothetical protein
VLVGHNLRIALKKTFFVNFENADSGLAVKMLFRQRTDSASFYFSPLFLPL